MLIENKKLNFSNANKRGCVITFQCFRKTNINKVKKSNKERKIWQIFYFKFTRISMVFVVDPLNLELQQSGALMCIFVYFLRQLVAM